MGCSRSSKYHKFFLSWRRASPCSTIFYFLLGRFIFSTLMEVFYLVIQNIQINNHYLNKLMNEDFGIQFKF